MNLNPIQIILDDNGVMVDEYTILPSINQYATNYELNVAFLNDMTSARVMKAIFTINGVATPAKVLSPTLERIKLSDDKTSYYKHSYQLTQYETQFYQPELRIDIYVYNDTETQIANTSVLLPMVKQSFNKLTPADLDSDSSINSVVKAMYDLEAAVIENVGVNTDSFETKIDAAAKLEEAKAYTDSEINSVKTNITENYATISYVDSQDSTVYNNSKTYTDSAISTSETNTLRSAKSYTENSIYRHNVSNTAHEDIRTSLSNKAEQSYLTSNYYDKTTVDNKISAIDIPSVEGLASETYVNTKIADLVNSAPETFDTLGELAAALEENKDLVNTLNSAVTNKQDKLESGVNIKTINGNTILGSGDITITGGGSTEGLATEEYVNTQISAVNTSIASKQDTLESGVNIKTINGNSILGAGDLTLNIPSTEGLATEEYVTNALTSKQDTLVSGSNIKTINGSTILGEGDLTITVSNANAVSFETLEAMVATLNTALQGAYEQYETIYIAEQNVPDFWIYSVENTPVTGTVPTEFTAQFYQFGYYKLALLETTKLVSNTNITYSATAPENPTVGDIWLNPTSAEFYDLPAYSADTSGSVLGVNSDGALEWTKTYGTYGLTKIGTVNASMNSETEYSFTTSGAVFYIVMYQTSSDNVTSYGYFPLFIPIGLTSEKISATVSSSKGITVTTTENSIGFGYISSSYKGYIGDVYAFRKIS